MTIDVQKVQVEDVEALRKISIETFGDTFGAENNADDLEQYYQNAYNLKQLTSEIKNPNSLFFFAKQDDQLAGYLKVNINEAQSEKMESGTLEVERIYVRKEFKRLGIGSEMMQQAIEVAKENHKNKVWLGVWERNEAAKKFYQTKGFKQIGAHVFRLGDDLQRDLIMLKEL
jgi:ribosomal protein S18 acetylase RimI-like enzyme